MFIINNNYLFLKILPKIQYKIQSENIKNKNISKFFNSTEIKIIETKVKFKIAIVFLFFNFSNKTFQKWANSIFEIINKEVIITITEEFKKLFSVKIKLKTIIAHAGLGNHLKFQFFKFLSNWSIFINLHNL